MNVAEWIAEHRRLDEAATEGPWEWDTDLVSLLAGYEGIRDVINPLTSDEAIVGSDDAAFIADARTSLPVALNALEAVLALHCSAPLFSVDGRDCEVHGTACEDNVPVCVACIDCEGEAETYPCPTVRAITEALGVES